MPAWSRAPWRCSGGREPVVPVKLTGVVLRAVDYGEADRIVTLVDRMEVFGDERPVHKESVNIHTVLDHVRQIARAGFARHLTITQSYDPSLPTVPGNRDKLIESILEPSKEIAPIVGVRHHKTVERWAREKGFPCVRIGRNLRFRPGDVLRWLAQRKE